MESFTETLPPRHLAGGFYRLKIHPSHKIVGIDIMNDKIRYCKYCWIYATHPEIEKPCSDKPDLYELINRQHSAAS